MINLVTTSSIIGDSLLNMLNSILLFFDSLIYWFISLMYQVFIAISQVNLFEESTLRSIIDRVFTILGIVMLFIMAYEIILLIINPDKLSGDNGAKRLVTKVLTSIILIVLLPTIFKYMQVFQYNVLTSNVIGNVILGSSKPEGINDDLKSAGTSMALTIGSTFFYPVHNGVEYTYQDCLEVGGEVPICSTYIEAYKNAFESNNPGSLLMSFQLHSALHLNIFESFVGMEAKMKYIPIISTIAGILALKIITAFCLDIGVRVAKLGFLQVISPLPIALNITAKESIFSSKWFNSLKETYLSIFMKLIIIYFAMFAIGLVPEVISNIWGGVGNFFIRSLTTVAVILGILQFAKDGPELLKQLFNMELNFSIKKRLGENEYAMRGATAISGMGRGALQGNVPGAFFGAFKGWKLGGDIKDPTKIAGAGRMAASEGMKTKQGIASEIRQYNEKGAKGYIKEKAQDKIKDFKGLGTRLFDQSLTAANMVESSRSEFSSLLVSRTSVGRAETARDEQYTNIMGSSEGFQSEYKAEFARNPGIKGEFIDEKGVIKEDGQFKFAEYMRKQANKSIDKLKIEQLKEILGNPTHSKYGGITSQIEATIDGLKENKHLLGAQINQIITDYNKAGEERLKEKTISFKRIDAGDLDTLHAELIKEENADLTVEIVDSKIRGVLADAVGEFKSKRATAAKDK